MHLILKGDSSNCKGESCGDISSSDSSVLLPIRNDNLTLQFVGPIYFNRSLPGEPVTTEETLRSLLGYNMFEQSPTMHWLDFSLTSLSRQDPFPRMGTVIAPSIYIMHALLAAPLPLRESWVPAHSKKRQSWKRCPRPHSMVQARFKACPGSCSSWGELIETCKMGISNNFLLWVQGTRQGVTNCWEWSCLPAGIQTRGRVSLLPPVYNDKKRERKKNVIILYKTPLKWKKCELLTLPVTCTLWTTRESKSNLHSKSKSHSKVPGRFNSFDGRIFSAGF